MTHSVRRYFQFARNFFIIFIFLVHAQPKESPTSAHDFLTTAATNDASDASQSPSALQPTTIVPEDTMDFQGLDIERDHGKDPDEKVEGGVTLKPHAKFSESETWGSDYPKCNPKINNEMSPIDIITKVSVEVKNVQTLMIYSGDPIKNYSLSTSFKGEGGVVISALNVLVDRGIFYEATHIGGLGNRDFRLFRRMIFLFSKNKLNPHSGLSLHRVDGKIYPMEILMFFYNQRLGKVSTQVSVMVEIQEEENPMFFPITQAVEKIINMKSKTDLIKELEEKIAKEQAVLDALLAEPKNEKLDKFRGQIAKLVKAEKSLIEDVHLLKSFEDNAVNLKAQRLHKLEMHMGKMIEWKSMADKLQTGKIKRINCQLEIMNNFKAGRGDNVGQEDRKTKLKKLEEHLLNECFKTRKGGGGGGGGGGKGKKGHSGKSNPDQTDTDEVSQPKSRRKQRTTSSTPATNGQDNAKSPLENQRPDVNVTGQNIGSETPQIRAGGTKKRRKDGIVGNSTSESPQSLSSSGGQRQRVKRSYESTKLERLNSLMFRVKFEYTALLSMIELEKRKMSPLMKADMVNDMNVVDTKERLAKEQKQMDALEIGSTFEIKNTSQLKQVLREKRVLELEISASKDRLDKIKAELEVTKGSTGWISRLFLFQPSWLFPAYGGYYYYPGSSPIPPCRKRVFTLVLKKPVAISQEQYNLLSSVPAYEDYEELKEMVPRLREVGNRTVNFNRKNIQYLLDDGVHLKSSERRRLKESIKNAAVRIYFQFCFLKQLSIVMYTAALAAML